MCMVIFSARRDRPHVFRETSKTDDLRRHSKMMIVAREIRDRWIGRSETLRDDQWRKPIEIIRMGWVKLNYPMSVYGKINRYTRVV